jgi:hypothetical protein
LIDETDIEEDKAAEIDTAEIAEVTEKPVEELQPAKTGEIPLTEITTETPEEAPAVEDSAFKKRALEEDEVITRNQKISAQLGDKAVSKTDQASIKPISDIKLAITLNDKLLYVKDLFNGYNLAYSEAVEILNRFNTFEEAQRFLKTNYVTKNNWEGKAATAEKFYALLKRRYA